MDFRQLEMFLAVAENRSFTRASQQLHVAQSAISRKVKLLEEELGVALFKRVNKKVFITPAGETLLRYTRKVFRDLKNAALEVSEIGQLRRGRVKIGAGLIACNYLLPPVLERFKERYPGVDLEVITGSTERLLDLLRNNELDLGLFTLPVESPDLQVIPLCSEEMVVVTSPKHPVLSQRRTLAAAEIERYPLIPFQEGTYTRRLLNRFFHEVGIRPHITMEAENVATIKPLVKINLGISILPLPAVLEEVQRKELHYLTFRGVRLKREQGLVFHKSEPLPRVIQELVDLFTRASGTGKE